jgi:hypothetical protein
MGPTLCNGQCVFPTSDPANCGACGMRCPGALACINGTCGCPQGLTDCADVCVDTNVDGNNCGSCGATCVAGMVCSSGMCEVTCGANLQQCGNGCVDTQNDPKNCGMCQKACAPNQICCSGTCVFDDTTEHCGGCAPCPNPGDFCGGLGVPDAGLTCSAG